MYMYKYGINILNLYTYKVYAKRMYILYKTKKKRYNTPQKEKLFE